MKNSFICVIKDLQGKDIARQNGQRTTLSILFAGHVSGLCNAKKRKQLKERFATFHICLSGVTRYKGKQFRERSCNVRLKCYGVKAETVLGKILQHLCQGVTQKNSANNKLDEYIFSPRNVFAIQAKTFFGKKKKNKGLTCCFDRR